METDRFATRASTALLVLVYAFAMLPSGLSWDFDTERDVLEGSWVVRLQWTPLFLLAFFILIRAGIHSWSHHLRLNPLLWLSALLALVSVAWSPLPVTSLKRVIQLFGMLAICLAVTCVARTATLQWIRLTLVVMVSLLIASIIMVIVNPTLGKESFAGLDGAWRGVLAQKNWLGMTVSITFIFVVFHCFETRTPWSLRALALIPTFICMVGARSSTSITVATLGTVTFLLLRKDHIGSTLWRMRIFSAALSVVLIGFLLFFSVNSRPPQWSEIIGPLASLFGKSSDLTGRTDIWQYMWPVIDQHPIFGIGYGAFWLGPGSPAQAVIDNLDWIPNQSHDGFIDVTNELGLLGLILILGAVLIQIRNLWELSAVMPDRAAMHSALLLLIMFSNVTESSLLQPLTIYNILLFFSFIQVNQLLWSARQAKSTPVLVQV